MTFMHAESAQFMRDMKARHPRFFVRARILECGSCDINGNNRHFFEDCEYVGLDIAPGPNVDVVSHIKDFRTDILFDTIISTNAFEHDQEYSESLKNIYQLLRVGGLFIFSCSAPGTKEHGTINSDPAASLTSSVWGNYYKNLTEEDIREVFPVEGFSPYKFNLMTRDKGMGVDLQFWGIKNAYLQI